MRGAITLFISALGFALSWFTVRGAGETIFFGSWSAAMTSILGVLTIVTAVSLYTISKFVDMDDELSAWPEAQATAEAPQVAKAA
ncbi:MAG: hypothetical protein NW201_14180 [Gemmatimonadales bacterium]|nr:hypothetical protein [Gemmatimonadales bacterium]